MASVLRFIQMAAVERLSSGNWTGFTRSFFLGALHVDSTRACKLLQDSNAVRRVLKIVHCHSGCVMSVQWQRGFRRFLVMFEEFHLEMLLLLLLPSSAFIFTVFTVCDLHLCFIGRARRLHIG